MRERKGTGLWELGWSTGFLRAYYSFDRDHAAGSGWYQHAYKTLGGLPELGNETEAFFTETGALWMLGKSSTRKSSNAEAT